MLTFWKSNDNFYLLYDGVILTNVTKI